MSTPAPGVFISTFAGGDKCVVKYGGKWKVKYWKQWIRMFAVEFAEHCILAEQRHEHNKRAKLSSLKKYETESS
jgi:hypothetical protein